MQTITDTAIGFGIILLALCIGCAAAILIIAGASFDKGFAEDQRRFRSCAMREMVAQNQLNSVIRRAARAEHERKRRERLKALDASEFYDGVYESEEIL